VIDEEEKFNKIVNDEMDRNRREIKGAREKLERQRAAMAE
jgi:hypothetical protein